MGDAPAQTVSDLAAEMAEIGARSKSRASDPALRLSGIFNPRLTNAIALRKSAQAAAILIGNAEDVSAAKASGPTRGPYRAVQPPHPIG